MYKNYVFDLYGTLVDIKTNESRPNLWRQIAYLYGYFGAVYDPKELRRAYRRDVIRRQAALKEKNPDVVYPEIELKEVFAELFAAKGVDASADMVHEIARAFRAISTIRLQLFPGTIEMLSALKEAGANVYLLSNAQSCFTMPELKYLGLTDYLDRIYLSSDAQVKKPDPLFYQKLIQEQQLDPAETIMTGNEYLCDIRGAQQVGFDTLYIKSPQTPEQDPYETSTYDLDHMDMELVKQILCR